MLAAVFMPARMRTIALTPRVRRLLWRLGCVALLMAATATPRARAQGADSELASALGQMVAAAELGDGIGISVVDLATGEPVFARTDRRPRNPASNMKVLTAAAALVMLGPDYRFRTGLYGRQRGDAIVGGLYLRGMGDPMLTTSDLMRLADDLAMRGVQRVDAVRVDGTYFDDAYVPPAFEQQPHEPAAFRAAVAALSVNRSAFSFRVAPGSLPGDLSRVYLDAPAYFDIDNQLRTSPRGRLNVVAVQEDGSAQMVLRLRGSIPLGISGVSYRRRVASPLHYAGHLMTRALRQAGIDVGGRLELERTPDGTALLAQHTSQPLSQVLHELGKYSDNFVAEMVLKTMGAEGVSTPGTSQNGVMMIHKQLGALGVPTEGTTLINGSGLFNGNLIAPRLVTALLVAMSRRNDCFPEFLSQLAIGGKDGTLQTRLQMLPRDVVVRAKTGTLNDVIGLSGYVMPRSGLHGYAFSFLANGISGKQSQARALSDDLVTHLARRLSAER